MHLKLNKCVVFQHYNRKKAKKYSGLQLKIAKIADVQAQNASQRDAF